MNIRIDKDNIKTNIREGRIDGRSVHDLALYLMIKYNMFTNDGEVYKYSIENDYTQPVNLKHIINLELMPVIASDDLVNNVKSYFMDIGYCRKIPSSKPMDWDDENFKSLLFLIDTIKKVVILP